MHTISAAGMLQRIEKDMGSLEASKLLPLHLTALPCGHRSYLARSA